MVSPTFTERRLYRNASMLLGFQSAAGTKLADFTTAATRAIWCDVAMHDPQIEKEDFQGATGTARARSEGRYSNAKKPIMQLVGAATPKNIEWLLRSWGGTWAGSPTMTLTLTEAINEWASLGLVEKVVPDAGNLQKFLRTWDAWIHRIEFKMASGLSALRFVADVAARDFDRTTMTPAALAAAGITLPTLASGYAPPAIDVFAPHGARLYRDPAGANVSIAIEELTLTLEHGLGHEHWNDETPQVVKEGHTRIRLDLRSRWLDETYGIQNDAETIVPTFKRFRAEWLKGAKSFIVDMKNVDFKASPTGWREGAFAEYLVFGEAMYDGTNYVDFTLTP